MNINEEKKPVTPVVEPAVSPASVVAPSPVKDSKITYNDFAKVEITAGKILSAEKIPDTDKLLKLSVDFAEATPRQIISGIAMYFADPAALVGRTAMFVTNLEPRKIRGYESNGMLFAVSTPPVIKSQSASPASAESATTIGAVASIGAFSLLEPGPGIPPGTRAQ